MSNNPLVSVVMAVYNSEDFLKEAIDSILNQTYKNLELIIIDDGSTDDSKKIIKNYKDSRIKYYYQANKGLSAALNSGISKSKGEYIARMDSDDVSYPSRIQQQVDFLKININIAMVGSSFDIINERGEIKSSSYHLCRSEDLALEFLVRNPFGHGTIMIRKEILQSVGGYDVNSVIEDYDIWWRVAKTYKVRNLPDKLYGWRIVPSGMSHGGSAERQGHIHDLTRQIWESNTGIKISKQQVNSGVKYYYGYGAEYGNQFLFMLAAVCLGSFKMRRYRTFLNILSKIILKKTGIVAIKTLLVQPWSYQYNLPLIHKD